MMTTGKPLYLFTHSGRLRFYAKVCIFILCGTGSVLIFPYMPYGNAFTFEYFTLGIILISAALIHFVEKRPFASLGLAWNAFTTRHIYWGFGVGAVLITIAVTMLNGFGYAEIEAGYWTWDSVSHLCANQFVFFFFAAAVEELLFRGYLFQAAIESSNVTVAVIASSLLFSIVHSWNPGITGLAYCNIFIAGLLFAGAYIRTRQLWLPIALHAGWNFFQGTIYGADISGVSLGGHLLTTSLSGPEWLTGGAFGPEGSIFTTLVLILGIVAVQALPQFQISPEQYVLWHRIRYAEDYAEVFPVGNAS